jgi:hypothetical protein
MVLQTFPQLFSGQKKASYRCRLNVPDVYAVEQAAAPLALQRAKFGLEFARSVILREKNPEVYRGIRTMRG